MKMHECFQLCFPIIIREMMAFRWIIVKLEGAIIKPPQKMEFLPYGFRLVGAKGEYFVICWLFLFIHFRGLSCWIHIVFTLEFKQSWKQLWHSFCSICLTDMCLFVFVLVRVRDREKEKERAGILLDGLTHIQTHLHAVPGMVRQRLRQTRYTVVTISQDLDSHTLVFLKEREVKGRQMGIKWDRKCSFIIIWP